jgi:UPF0042 nucleotide-binding protein
MKLFVISGRSGSGKSITLRYLEDLGFYCVDNLPLDLFPKLCDELKAYQNIAVSIDARNHLKDLSRFREMLEKAKQQGQTWEVIYMDADDNMLLRRYSETRRKHPLTTQQIDLKNAIQLESKLLEPVADCADLIIDTTNLSAAQLGELLRTRVIARDAQTLSLLFTSFGFKHGIPAEADYVFDVRCLPNPYWVPELRALTGLDPAVAQYLSEQPRVQAMLSHIIDFLDTWIPCFQADNRSYLTIALGCTGGQHRSVYLIEELGKIYRKKFSHVQIRHRELGT